MHHKYCKVQSCKRSVPTIRVKILCASSIWWNGSAIHQGTGSSLTGASYNCFYCSISQQKHMYSLKLHMVHVWKQGFRPGHKASLCFSESIYFTLQGDEQEDEKRIYLTLPVADISIRLSENDFMLTRNGISGNPLNFLLIFHALLICVQCIKWSHNYPCHVFISSTH